MFKTPSGLRLCLYCFDKYDEIQERMFRRARDKTADALREVAIQTGDEFYSQQADAMQNSSRTLNVKTNNFHITDSQVGMLNAGSTMRDVQRIDITLSKLQESSAPVELVDGLKRLTQAVIDSTALSAPFRDEIVRWLKIVATQAVLSPEKRERPLVEAATNAAATVLAHTANFAQLWQVLYPAICAHFGMTPVG